MIKHQHTRNSVILHFLIGFKAYRKLYINHTLKHVKTAFLDKTVKEVKQ